MADILKRREAKCKEYQAPYSDEYRPVVGVMVEVGFNAGFTDQCVKDLVEAAEFAAMPLTGKSPTVESLLETIKNDRDKLIEALANYTAALKIINGGE